MSGNCSICLSAYKEPVNPPCGHVYCRKCLADHVNSSGGMDEITASCPTCRSTFYTVMPDLTYLPEKYHQYVLPAVRRVYVDNSSVSSLQRKLARAEARVAKLENEQEILLKQCEAHMAASQAHAFSEHTALKEVERLKKEVDGLSTHMEDTEVLHNELENCVSQVKDEVTYWKSKYSKMKLRLQGLDRATDNIDNSILHSKRKSNSSANTTLWHSAGTLVMDEISILETPTAASRHIKPIPRRGTRASSSSQSHLVTTERPKRPRVSLPSVHQ